MSAIHLAAERGLASDSPDHQAPFGARRDNSRYAPFNRKLYALMPHKPLWILDIGCAGGGFVKDCCDDGHEAYGIDGTDYGRITGHGEWPAIPDRLFVADASYPFYFTKGQDRVLFDVVTAWEVLEHIPEARLDTFMDNVRANLKPDGLFICSIAFTYSPVAGVEYHQNVQTPEWWADRLTKLGWTADAQAREYFGTDFVRGERLGEGKNWALRP